MLILDLVNNIDNILLLYSCCNKSGYKYLNCMNIMLYKMIWTFSIIVIPMRNSVEVNFVTALLSFDAILITMKCSGVKAPLVLTCLINDGKCQS